MPYKVRDLMINVIASGGGGAVGLPADDTQPVPTPITPIAITATFVQLTPQLELAGPLVKEALAVSGRAAIDNPHAMSIARAGLGAGDGSPAFVQVNKEFAAAAVGAAVLQTGGSAGMPNPECGGTSYETIPTPITPYVHKAAALLQAEHLPRLKERLVYMLNAVEAAEKTLLPTGRAASDLRERMQGAIAELANVATAKS